MTLDLLIPTPTIPDLTTYVLHTLTAAIGILCLWFWLRRELTPGVFLSIWKSNGELSSRQILAWVIACYGMYMRYLGNLDNDGMNKCFEAAFILFGIGGVVKAAGAIKAPTTVNTGKVGEMTIQPEPTTPQGPPVE